MSTKPLAHTLDLCLADQDALKAVNKLHLHDIHGATVRAVLLKKLEPFLEYEARKKEAAKPKLQSKRARLIVRNLAFNVTKVG